MADTTGNLDFMQTSLNNTVKQIATGAEIEATAVDQKDILAAMNFSSQKVLDASSTLVEHNEDVVSNASAFASIAAEMDGAIREGQKATQNMAAVDLNTTKLTNSLNAPVRSNYTQEISDPSINEEEDYQRNQIAIYQKRLRDLQNDQSFTGQLKRLTLEGATRRRLDQAQQGYAAVQQQKQAAISSFSASLKANNMFSMSTSAVERAEVSDSLVRAESAIKIIASKGSLNAADEKKLGATLMLDKARLSHFQTEYQLLKERGAATNSVIGALQSKLYAQQVQEQAAGRADKKTFDLERREQWDTFVKDNIPDTAKQTEILKAFPDPTAKNFTENGLGVTFLSSLGKKGTKNEYAKGVLTKLGTDIQLETEQEHVAAKLISQGVSQASQALRMQLEQQIANNRGKDPKPFQDEFNASMKDLMSLDGQAAFYEVGLNAIKANAATGIYSGAIVVPDMNASLADPQNPYSAQVSDDFKKVLLSDEFKGINLGFKSKTDVTAQFDGTMANVVSYLLTQSERDIRGKIQFTPETSKLVTTVSQGLADYYKVARLMTNQSDSGLGSDVLPQLAIMGMQGQKLVLENASQMEQLIRTKLQNARGETSFLENLTPTLSGQAPATPTPNQPARHITGL